MRVKKFNGKVFGADFTASERQAMSIEINRQILEADEKYKTDIDAMVLYTLMVHYGWKKKRLKKFWDAFLSEHKSLREFYQMSEPGDNAWLAHHKLKEIGVDISQWYKEEESNA